MRYPRPFHISRGHTAGETEEAAAAPDAGAPAASATAMAGPWGEAAGAEGAADLGEEKEAALSLLARMLPDDSTFVRHGFRGNADDTRWCLPTSRVTVPVLCRLSSLGLSGMSTRRRMRIGWRRMGNGILQFLVPFACPKRAILGSRSLRNRPRNTAQ